MNKKNIVILSGLVFLAIAVGALLLFLNSGPTPTGEITFAECERAGGEAWRVDFSDPDICPACAEYAACLEEYPQAADIRQACPSTYPCGDCMQDNFPYPDRCPGGMQVVGQISDAAIWFLCCTPSEVRQVQD